MKRPWLAPLTPIYAAALSMRNLRIDNGWELVRRLRFPVVSIGNLSTGGAGKTPLTIALANALTQRGFHVDVLSRGYGRQSQLPARVNPEGAAEEYGDEPLLIARSTGVPVYVAAERYRAGQLAEAEGMYRQILHDQPNHPDALHLLGVAGCYDRHVWDGPHKCHVLGREVRGPQRRVDDPASTAQEPHFEVG